MEKISLTEGADRGEAATSIETEERDPVRERNFRTLTFTTFKDNVGGEEEEEFEPMTEGQATRKIEEILEGDGKRPVLSAERFLAALQKSSGASE